MWSATSTAERIGSAFASAFIALSARQTFVSKRRRRCAVPPRLACVTRVALLAIALLPAHVARAFDVSEDSSLVVDADALNFVEPDAVLVTEDPTGTATIDTSQYALKAGRPGSTNNVLISTNDLGVITGSSGTTPFSSNLVLNPNSSDTTTDGFRGTFLDFFPGGVTLDSSSGALLASLTDHTIAASSAEAQIIGMFIGGNYLITDSSEDVSIGMQLANFNVQVQTNQTLSAAVMFDSGPKFRAVDDDSTPSTLTIPLIVGLRDRPAAPVDVPDTGTVLVTELTTVVSAPEVSGGELGTARVATRRGLHFKDNAVPEPLPGNVDTSVAVDVEDQTVDTLACSLRSVGADVQMRHVGPAIFGANAAPGSGVDVQTSLGYKRAAVSDANYMVSTSDLLVAYTWLTSPRTITLPDPSNVGVGRIVIIKDETGNAGTYNLTVQSAGGNIDGAASQMITAGYGSATFYSNGRPLARTQLTRRVRDRRAIWRRAAWSGVRCRGSRWYRCRLCGTRFAAGHGRRADPVADGSMDNLECAFRTTADRGRTRLSAYDVSELPAHSPLIF